MVRDDEVGVTYQISGPFGEEPPLQTVQYDRLRCYSLPVAFPLEGLSRSLLSPSPATAWRGDATAPSSPAGVSLFGKDVDCDIGPSSGAGDSPEQAVALPRFSRVGRSSRPPAHFRDYVTK